MLGGKRGGIEQALVDSSEALRLQGHEVTAFIRDRAAIAPVLKQAGIPFQTLYLPSRWNLFARAALACALRRYDLVLVHGNRAGQMTRGTAKLPPILAVSHSRFFTPMKHFAGIIALSADRARDLGTPYVVPNLVRLPAYTPRTEHTPPVIGALGRFSTEKGMDMLVDALHLLHQRGIAFETRIGGDGPQKKIITERIAMRGLGDKITLLDWVADKDAFYRGIDLFVLPSRSETFPITLLEAMSHACPVVATRCGGAERIMKSGLQGLLCEITAHELANALEWMVTHPAQALAMGAAGRTHAEQHYAIDVVGKKLSDIAAEIVAQTATPHAKRA